MIKLMCDNVVVAIQEEGKRSFLVIDGIPNGMLPFMPIAKTRVLSSSSIYAFIEDRIFPPNRIGVEELLMELGLSEYDPWEIMLKNRASSLSDPWWFSITDTDDWRVNTLRGKLDYTPWPIAFGYNKQGVKV